MGKPERKRPLGRLRHRWKDNIKMVLQLLRWGVHWIDLAQNKDMWRAVMNAVMKLLDP